VAPGDIITAVDGARIDSWNDFVRDVVMKKIGDKVTLTVVRNHQTVKVSVQLAERPAETR
jgi:S1-C subfamily serine protease